MHLRTILISILLALSPVNGHAADCANCRGGRVVGQGPVRWACPVCLGTGSVPDPSPVAAASQPTAAGRPRPVVARITAADGPSRICGSGVLVQASGSSATVLTNWHVVRSHRDGLSVSWPDGSASPASVVASDDSWDLAALAVPAPKAAPVPIAASAPRLGDSLTIAGYGPDGTYREQTGPVTDFLSPTREHARQFVELRAAARQGDSGGPIFNDRGELAGVLFGCKDGLTCGSCSTRLQTFLDSAGRARHSAAAAPKPACKNGRCAIR